MDTEKSKLSDKIQEILAGNFQFKTTPTFIVYIFGGVIVPDNTEIYKNISEISKTNSKLTQNTYQSTPVKAQLQFGSRYKSERSTNTEIVNRRSVRKTNPLIILKDVF